MIIFFAKYLFLFSFILAAFLFLSLSTRDKKKMFILSLVSGVISLVLLKISSALFYNPRPFVVNHVLPLIAHDSTNGFPSDHTLLTMWLAMVVLVYKKWLGVILIIISLTVGISRVLALVHHPIDIIGSIIIAAISVFISRLIITRLNFSFLK